MIDELLAPATDRGVAAQLIALIVGTAAVCWLLRSHRHWQLVALGVALLLLGAMGLRAAH